MLTDIRKWGTMKKIGLVRSAFSVLILMACGFGVGMDVYTYAQTPAIDHTEIMILKDKVERDTVQSDRRLKDLEDDSKSSNRRVTVLETMAESNTYYLRAVTLAIILMAAKELFVFNTELKRRGQKQRVGDPS